MFSPPKGTMMGP